MLTPARYSLEVEGPFVFAENFPPLSPEEAAWTA